LSKCVLNDVFGNLLENERLAKKILGIKSGRPPDFEKRRADERLAMLVL